MFKKILVAARGEIALRIIRACEEIGIKTVQAHSTADAESLPVRFASDSICIGPPQVAKSYLNNVSILSAARLTGCDALHPGYGFLAENANFADMCENSGIKFIGPPTRCIELSGNKAKAREVASSLDLPILSGSNGGIKSYSDAEGVASKIGYPVLLKACFGGGGRGIRIVNKKDELKEHYESAGAEALGAFGDAELYIEKYLLCPRHIEFQVLVDGSGKAVHLGERDCSIQRRHQKIVEEAPSPKLNGELRDEMGEAAIKLMKGIEYESVGTVEFLVKGDEYYFMEINARIQVEHPVTEVLTGIDLVKEQIKLAAGEPLRFVQDEIDFRGHAIEVRINAEDPETFAPSPGTITAYHAPGGPGIRVDSAAFANAQIPPYYDSLVAKLICHGNDREEALARLKRALDEMVIEGIDTNIVLLREITTSPDFVTGEYDTSFMENR